MLLGASLVVAVLASRLTLGIGLASRQPLLALKIDPGNDLALSQAAQATLGKGNEALPSADALAGAALDRDLTLTPAIETRALALRSRGQANRAERLIDLSSEISRRSLGTHLWLIQRAVDRGDVAGALDQFDQALRTSLNAPPLLFPVLGRAMADPTLAAPLARLLDRPSDWRAMFVVYVAGQTGLAKHVAPVVVRISNPAFLRQPELDRPLVNAIVRDGDFAGARQVEQFLSGRPHDGLLLHDSDFSNAKYQPPFGWEFTQGSTIWTVRDKVGGRSALLFNADRDAAGQAAAQLLTMPTGEFNLRVETATALADASAPPSWTLTCASAGGHQLTLLKQPAGTGQAAELAFTVPPDCPAQWLVLTIEASEAPKGQSGAIRSVDIVRR